ncbi:cell wall elongation regulator TseB-like domain-containing protein [Paenibacillus urinalis]|uniref:cell wall elongation regulator TseB-like domain-containing protein n=1 Tax=Paenibacillus urinalis TaxID=521520 RepID=UPI001961F574
MRKKRKWILISIVAFILVLLGIYIFYEYVMKDTWVEEEAAIAIAKEKEELVTVTKTQKSVWSEDAIYWTIEGVNADNEPIMVWVQYGTDKKPKTDEKSVHSEKIEEGTSEEEMRSKISSQLPGIEIVRLQPAVYDETYVWQLFYKENDRYYYRFYRFSDGTELEEGFQLPVKE